MRKLFRYGLILLGLAVFLVLSPIILIYLTGTIFNPLTGEFTKTGIINTTTTPSGAQLIINGSVAGKTPISKRFLLPGEYTVQINLPDYHPWTTIVRVNAGQVTFLNWFQKALPLLPIEQPVQLSSSADLSAVDEQGNIWITQGQSLINLSQDGSSSQSLPLGFTPTQLVATNDNSVAVINENKFLIVNTKQDKVDWPVPPSCALVSVNFVTSNRPVGLCANGDLGWWSEAGGQKQFATVVQQVTAVTTEDDNVYLAENNGGVRIAWFNFQNRMPGDRTVVSEWQSGTPIITQLKLDPQRHGFALNTNNELIPLGSTDTMAKQVTSVQTGKGIAVWQSGEELVWQYLPTASNGLIIRDKNIGLFSAASIDLPFVFYVSGKQIVAQPLYNQGELTRYTLAQAGQVKKLFVDPSGTYLYWQDNNGIFRLRVKANLNIPQRLLGLVRN